MSTITPQHDPVERLHATRRRVVRIGVICCVIATGAVIWLLASSWGPWGSWGPDSLGPGRDLPVPPNELDFAVGIDASVFDVALWTPPPAPVVKDVVAVAPPPPPLKFQLLGISGDGTKDSPLRAALYDPDTDRVILIGQGERLSSFTVRALTNEAIEFVDGARIERLSLREPANSQPSGGGSR